MITLPTVNSSGSVGILGQLIFGIGTHLTSNISTNIASNVIPIGTNIYQEDPNGNFTTNFTTSYSSYNSGPQNTSYLDSGSIALYFYDPDIPQDSQGFYNSNFPITINGTNPSSTHGSVTIPISIANADLFVVGGNYIVAANIGGAGTNGTFDWGLPFFYGRTVFTGISGSYAPTQSGTQVSGPFWAY